MARLDKGLNRLQTGCIFLLANLFLGGFCLWGTYAAYVGWQLETNGETTSGTVIEMNEFHSSDGGPTYSPIVEYEVSGQTYSFDSRNASYPPEYSVGDNVTVRYNRERPSVAQIDKWTERWLFPIIIIPAMILVAAVVNFILISAWRRGQSVDWD